MRLMIAVFASLGLMTSACGKKAEPPKPEPTKAATTEPTKAPETKAAEADAAAPETKAAEADAGAPAAEDAVAAAPEDAAAPVATDRAAEVTKTLEAYAAGKLDETFANFADTATWTELGNPMAAEPIVGKAAIIEFHKKQMEGMTEAKFKATRVFDAGEYVAVEATWSAKNTGAMQGHEPTNKEAAVAGTYVVHYGADGKIDKAWSIFDTASMLTQLGIMPGAATPGALAETVELVKGDANQANVDTFKAAVEKLSAATADEVLGGLFADDYEHTAGPGQVIKGKAEAIAALKGAMANMADFKVTVDLAFSTGDWVVAAQTQTYTYKGGIEGVEAKDQKVTLPSIAFARFEGGKMKAYRSYANNLGMLAQLGVQIAGAAEKPADAAGEKLGVEACDKFLAIYAQCVEAMPEAARGASRDAGAQMAKAWKDAITAGGDAVKAGLEDGCKKAFESTKTAMGAACPGVKWE